MLDRITVTNYEFCTVSRWPCCANVVWQLLKKPWIGVLKGKELPFFLGGRQSTMARKNLSKKHFHFVSAHSDPTF